MLLTMPPSRRAPQPSSLGLIVLWQLFAEPMHAYRMQKLFESQGKDRVVNLKSRARYPDRVVYAITDAGRDVARDWLRQMLSETGGQYPEFIAALSLVFGLPVPEAREQLDLRAERVAEQLDDAEQSLREAPPALPRLFLLEEEYRVAVLRAELDWLRGVIEDLDEGRITWSEEWLRGLMQTFLPTGQEPNEEEMT